MAEHLHYDLLIVGGGLVGASLAIALQPTGLKIGLIEAVPFKSATQPSYDDRAIALAYGTRRIFEGMGLWTALAPQVSPIKKIHISDRGRFGVTRLDCQEEGVEALGYVAETRVLGQVYSAALPGLQNVDVMCPATVTAVSLHAQHAEVTLDLQGVVTTLHSRLLVAADGAQSTVRELLNIPSRRWDYQQTAIITNITPARDHAHVAYERFTASGPLALLPMHGQRCAVVWTVHSHQADSVMAMNDQDFLGQLQQRFGQRLGDLTRVGVRRAYPLALVRALEHIRPRLAIIGNAAHTLHPVAAQGFNLGLRDVAVLAQVLAEAWRAGHDIGDLHVLKRYADWRKRDHLGVITFTDGLIRLFTNPLWPVAAARNVGMLAVDLLPPLKHFLTRHTMGLAGKLPRLARGLPL